MLLREDQRMTKQEASEKYNILISILDEYESWGLCQEVKKVMGHGSMMIQIWRGSV